MRRIAQAGMLLAYTAAAIGVVREHYVWALVATLGGLLCWWGQTPDRGTS